MGIVVTIFMIIILLLSISNPLRVHLQKYQISLAALALLAGLWNAFWHGVRHLGEMWGNAAFMSGLLMIFTSLLLLKTWPFAAKINNVTPAFVRFAALLALAIWATLYSYTLILLNIQYALQMQ